LEYAEQGYGKEVLGDWVSASGVGVRKYDDLTAIGMRPPGEKLIQIGFTSIPKNVFVYGI
jgi:hypothetical protein